ncbi:MAG: hypothetical protein KGI58_01545 [Patescibacteria group bacterium]|nr:hypothetical protein [Patescibacteria group bacterium]
MKIKAIKNLIAVMVFTLLFVNAGSVLAYTPDYSNPQTQIQNQNNVYAPAPYFTNNTGVYVPTYPNDVPVAPLQPVAPYIVNSYSPYSNTSNTNSNSNTTVTHTTPTQTVPRNTATTTTIQKVTAPSPSASEYSNTPGPDVRALPPVVTTDASNNGLAALSLAGTGSFMPSSLWQWLLVVLLIFVIIILARLIGRSRVHEVHTVATH